MGRNSPVEAEIHHFWGGKISIAKITETNSKMAPDCPLHPDDTQTIIFLDLLNHLI
jgi:hypothetical protein